MAMPVKWLMAVIALATAGCAVNNNYLKSQDFVTRLTDDGVKVDGFRRVLPDPFLANEGVAIKIAGSEIGVYKYDTSIRLQRNRLEKINRVKTLYIAGIPYPVVVRGSFVFYGLDKNPEKAKILKSIDKFD